MNDTLSWRLSAACLGLAPMFDLTADGGNRWSAKQDADRLARAVAICRRCPVTEQCRADARPGHDEGVRAGRVLPSIDRAVAS